MNRIKAFLRRKHRGEAFPVHIVYVLVILCGLLLLLKDPIITMIDMILQQIK